MLKRSFICCRIVCMTVPLTMRNFEYSYSGTFLAAWNVSWKVVRQDTSPWDAMDLDSVQKETVSIASGRCCIYFQSLISRNAWWLLQFLVKLLSVYTFWILSLHGKYKQLWDFGSNNGSIVRILISLVNQGCVIKRATTTCCWF